MLSTIGRLGALQATAPIIVAGDAACAEVAERQGTAWVTCAAPFTGRPDPGAIVGLHALSVSSSDPFEAGPSQATRLEVRNRAPRLATQSIVIPVPCTVDRTPCCMPGQAKGTCDLLDHRYAATSATAALVVDDDGDPVDLSATASGGCLGSVDVPRPCDGAGCDPALTLCAMSWGCGTGFPSGTIAVATSDGLASVSGSVSVAGECRP